MDLANVTTSTLRETKAQFLPSLFRSIYLFLGVALLVRLFALWQAPRLGFVIDEAEYYRLGTFLADGRGWSYFDSALWVRPPLYPLFLAGLFWLGGYNLLVVKLVQIFLSVATVFLLAKVAEQSFGRRVGLLSGWLAAVAWPFATLSILLLTETLFLFLFLLSLYFLLKAAHHFFNSPELNSKNLRIYFWPLVAGLFFGLAALTRGQVLSFIPLLPIWLFFTFGLARWKRALLFFLVLLAAFGLAISPWLLRNFVAYGRPLLDTTGGYNFYLGAQAARNEAVVNQTLESVPNQAERETLAYRKAFEIIAANPGAWLAKGLKESNDFWILNFGAEERLEDGYTKGYIAPSWLIAGQILGDTLYVVAGVLAIVGLLTASGGLRNFVAIWLGYNWALAFVFFAVSRFRWPVFYLLLILAAYILAEPRQVAHWLKLPLAWGKVKLANGRWAALLLPFLFLLIVLPTYQPFQTWHGLEEWGRYQHSLKADELRKAGRYAEALQEYSQASQYNQVTLVGIALTEALQGRYADAEARLQKINQDFAAVHLALGWLYLQQGNHEYASAEFRLRQVALDQGNDSDNWAWENLAVKPLPNNELKIGEFDWGYVEGFWFYERESGSATSFRWSAGRDANGLARSRLKFPLTPDAKPQKLSLKLKNYRPNSLPLPAIEVLANGQSLGKIKPGLDWQTFTLNLPANLTLGETLIIELRSENSFVPDGKTKRDLGFMLQAAKLD